MRTESSSSNFGWIGLAIFTIVLGVFVLPGGNIEKEGFAALQVNEETKVTEILAMPLGQLGSAAMYYGKLGLKYILILGYIWVVFRRVQQFLKRSKIKKI